jgi:hypothetical protein
VGVACGKAIEDLGEAGGAPGAPRLTRISMGRDGRWPSGDVAPWTRWALVHLVNIWAS